jgi:hypothetical protein
MMEGPNFNYDFRNISVIIHGGDRKTRWYVFYKIPLRLNNNQSFGHI